RCGLPNEKVAVGAKPFDPLWLCLHDPQGCECCGSHRRGQANRIYEARCRISKHIDERAAAGDVAPAGGQRFAERSHPYVDRFRIDTTMLGASSARTTKNPEAMG